MIDGRGRVRLTDFGLAGVAGTFEAHGLTSGTPASMAPEHFEGRGVTARTDLYALGLVLYGVFTGRPSRGWTPRVDAAIRRTTP
jgi:serine/threonine-protein kinase